MVYLCEWAPDRVESITAWGRRGDERPSIRTFKPEGKLTNGVLGAESKFESEGLVLIYWICVKDLNVDQPLFKAFRGHKCDSWRKISMNLQTESASIQTETPRIKPSGALFPSASLQKP